jgi:SAM-dependent methyltransferase
MNMYSDMMNIYFKNINEWFNTKPVEEIDMCMVCGEHFGDRISPNLRRCDNCSFIWRSPQPTQESLDEFYKDSKPMHIWGKIKKTNKENVRQYKKYESIWKLTKEESVFKVLDVGCGDGFFLNGLDSSVIKVGIEPNGNTKDRKFACYGSYGAFKDSLHSKTTYDMITMFGVLEHFKNPSEEMCRYKGYLKEGGILSVIVPNIDSLVCQTLGEECSTFCPQHLWYFNGITLNFFMERHGFKIKQWNTIEPEVQPVLKKLKGLPPYISLGFDLTDKDITEEQLLENGLGYKIVAQFIKE